jgi:hypothetical protein
MGSGSASKWPADQFRLVGQMRWRRSAVACPVPATELLTLTIPAAWWLNMPGHLVRSRMIGRHYLRSMEVAPRSDL